MSFVKREDESFQTLRSASADQQPHTVLGAGAEFEGKLMFRGAVRIDGRFRGEIVTDDVLVVGESAQVDAQINAGTLIINGTVRGEIHAQEAVRLQRPARVYGQVNTPSLTIDEGVVFEGACKMENLSKSEGHRRKSPNIQSGEALRSAEALQTEK
jgi:cytoskeletal protein CcmA (bactofilin family)